MAYKEEIVALEGTPRARIRVVAAVIDREGSVLLCRRPEYKQHGGLWEFPGGKVHEGESLGEAVERELTEELNVITTAVGEVLFSTIDERSQCEIVFLPTLISGEPEPIEHSALCWSLPEQLLSFELAPSDRAFANFFLSHGDD